MHQYESCNATCYKNRGNESRDESLREVLKVTSCGIIVFFGSGLQLEPLRSGGTEADFVRRSGVLWQLADAGLIEAESGSDLGQKVLF